MTQMQSADPGARKTAVLFIALAVVVGMALLALFNIYQPGLEAWLLDDAGEMAQKLNWILLILAVAIIPLLLGAILIWRFGCAVVKAARFPPPRFAVVRDTPVIEGSKAVTRGRIIKIIAILLGVSWLALPVMFWLVSRYILTS